MYDFQWLVEKFAGFGEKSSANKNESKTRSWSHFQSKGWQIPNESFREIVLKASRKHLFHNSISSRSISVLYRVGFCQRKQFIPFLACKVSKRHDDRESLGKSSRSFIFPRIASHAWISVAFRSLRSAHLLRERRVNFKENLHTHRSAIVRCDVLTDCFRYRTYRKYYKV